MASRALYFWIDRAVNGLIWGQPVRLKEVFTPGGQPSVTYVSREHLELEKKVREAIARGYSINVVTGPTKSGKTVLCRHVLSEMGESCTIEGGQIRSEEEFWTQIAHDLDIGNELTRQEAASQGGELGVEAQVGIKALNVKGATKGSDSRSSMRSIKYTVALQPAIYKELRRRDASLLVDDFHYIPTAVQKAIIQSLKGAVFDGLSVILLAVPHRAFDPMTVEDEVQGRFKHIEIPPWDMADLMQIPEKGFSALNVTSSSEINKAICNDGFGNPLLVQEICSEFCLKNDVFETLENEQALKGNLLPEAFADTAKSKGFPKYNKLKTGPDAKKKRQLRKFKDGAELDKYAAILKAIATIGPKPRTTYDELRSELQSSLVASSMPAKHEITSALVNMTKIARDKIEGEPPIEWVASDDVLVVTDPFLLFYMKWAEHHEAPGALLPL